MITQIIITTMMVIMPQVKVEAADPLTAKGVANNSEALYSMAEARDLSISEL